MTALTTEDPAAIEREIRETQDNMSRTVEKIGDQLTIKNLFNSLLDKADENNVDARMLIDGARRNPVALGLIAAGAIWLVSDKDSKIPSLGSKPDKSSDARPHAIDSYHRDYVSHMSSIEQRPDEDRESYERRRDTARSNFLMVERDHDEEEGSFRQRLNGMTDQMRKMRDEWLDGANQAQDATKQKAQSAFGTAQAMAGKAQDLYRGNPLVGGILAAALGAAFGSGLPITDQEKEKLGSLGDQVRDAVGQQTEQVAAQVRDKKDDLLEKADAALKPTDASSSEQGSQEKPKPFMAG